jgi:hypothetical protein
MSATGCWLRHSQGVGRGIDLHVALLELPFLVRFQQHGTDDAQNGLFRGADAADIGPAFHLLVQPFQRVGAVKLGSMRSGKAHVGRIGRCCG